MKKSRGASGEGRSLLAYGKGERRIATLTQRQKRFADCYLETGNAAEAARRAGYSGHEWRLKNHPAVKAYLEERLSAMDAARMASAEEVLDYLTRVMRGQEGGGGQAAMKAAELLGKRMGLFAEHEEALPPPVIIDDLEAQAQGG